MPPPYQAMLAINSDVEWTGWPLQLALYELFSAHKLETAFSFWFFCNPSFTWRLFENNLSPTPFAEAAYFLSREGLLDTNHSIGGRLHAGGCEYDRENIAKAYNVLATQGVRPAIYSNHGSTKDTQNIAGDWGIYQLGDVPSSPVYHMDMTVDAGVRYFWCDPDYVVETTALQAGLNCEDGIFVSDVARDGQNFLRFRRFMGQLPQGPSLDNLDQQIHQVLDAGRAGYTTIYQHLGVERLVSGKPAAANAPPFKPNVVEAIERLCQAQESGQVLVTTTERLLDHAAMMTAQPWTISSLHDKIVVEFQPQLEIGGCSWPLNWRRLEGFSLSVKDNRPVIASLGGETRQLQRWTSGNTQVAGIAWSRINTLDCIEQARRLSHTSA